MIFFTYYCQYGASDQVDIGQTLGQVDIWSDVPPDEASGQVDIESDVPPPRKSFQ